MSVRRLLLALLALNAVAAAWSWAVDGPTPSWVVYPLLLMGVPVLLRAGERRAAGYLGAVAALFTLVHVGFLRAAVSDSCAHPANPDLACHPTTWLATLGVVPVLTAVVAAAAALRSPSEAASGTVSVRA